MRTRDNPFLKRTAALASIALIASGCARLPSVEGVTAMSLSINTAPLVGLRASVNGDSDMGPGKAARTVLPPGQGCDSYMIFVCAIMALVVVPVAATVGAVVKTSQRLPLEQVTELNRVTADVASQLNLAASFITALQAEAQRRGIALNVANPGAGVLISPASLSWNISTGNRVAVRMEIDVNLQAGSEQGSRQVTYRGASAQVDDWVADNGQPIRRSLEDAMVGASREVWDKILGPVPRSDSE